MIPAVILAAFVLLQLVARDGDDRPLLWLAKPAAAAVFVAVAVARMRPGDPVDLLLVSGLLLGALGDVLLIPRRTFPAGLAAFLLGHLAYLAAFHLARPVTAWPAWTLLALAPAAAAAARWLWPHLGRLRAAVLAYVAVITLMAWGGLSVAGAALPWWVGPAAVLFWLSDLAVARNRFVAPGLLNRLLGLPAYSAAQLLLAFAVGG